MARNHAEPRLPFAPLERAIMAHYGQLSGVMSGTSVHRYRRVGITLSRADEWACRLGYHPADLWGDEWWSA